MFFRNIDFKFYVNADQLADRDIKLINEVLHTYYKTGNADVISMTAAKIAPILTVIIKDYNHITSVAE